jgi:hypothetical protein
LNLLMVKKLRWQPSSTARFRPYTVRARTTP